MIMKNTRSFFAIAALSLLTVSGFKANAQDEMDALRYSFITPMGTARSMGFGSALGSVGGDFTSLSVNPAGLGIYRRSEFMFTPSVKFNKVESQYLNGVEEENYEKFNFNNIGVVFTRSEKGRRYDREQWKAVSFAIGFNRLADFNRRYTYGGLMKGTSATSFSQVFIQDEKLYPGSISDNTTLASLGYETYLINPDTTNPLNPFTSVVNLTKGVNQFRSVKEKGGINELVLSLGGNYQEKLMIGATLGIPILRYKRENFFEETAATSDALDSFGYFRFNESLRTEGSGLNFKLGIIFKPVDNFRFGVAIHTPTWYRLSDVYNRSLTANTEQYQGVLSASNPENRFEYNLLTPWRTILSATGMMGQVGFITADYEYVSYNSSRFNFEDYPAAEAATNKAIKEAYQGASNFRLGVEARMDNFFIRGGFGLYGSPYKNSESNTNRMDYSTGIGYRTNSFFMDLAFVYSQYNQYETPYSLPYIGVSAPTAKLENKLSNLALTIGWKMD
jgi:hypothetical protein